MPVSQSSTEWFESRPQCFKQPARLSVAGLAFGPGLTVPSQPNTYSQSFRSAHVPQNPRHRLAYTEDGRPIMSSTTHPSHRYASEGVGVNQATFDGQFGSPGVVHHVVHHVHVPLGAQSLYPQAMPRRRQIRSAPQAHPISVEQAFQRALHAIGDNDLKITKERVATRPPPPVERKRRKLDPISHHAQVGDQVVHEVIEIEDSGDEQNDDSLFNRSPAKNSQPASNPGTLSGSPTTNIQSAKTSGLGEKVVSNIVSAAANSDTLLSNDTTHILRNMAGSDLEVAFEIAEDARFRKLDMDKEKLKDCLASSIGNKNKVELETILEGWYYRARRDVYHEIKGHPETMVQNLVSLANGNNQCAHGESKIS